MLLIQDDGIWVMGDKKLSVTLSLSKRDTSMWIII